MSYTLMDLLPMHDFVIVCISQLEDISSLIYAYHYTIFTKSHLLIIQNTDLIRKMLRCWEAAKLTVVDTSFPKL